MTKSKRQPRDTWSQYYDESTRMYRIPAILFTKQTEDTMEKEHDAVYKPPHYEKGGCVSMQRIVRDMFKGTEGLLPLSVYPWWKDALKYIWRWPLKHETMEKKIEDLNKAKRCIDMIIEELNHE